MMCSDILELLGHNLGVEPTRLTLRSAWNIGVAELNLEAGARTVVSVLACPAT